MTKKFTLSQTFFLSFLAMPLAFVGIPIYLNITDFYARSFSLSLALIGTMLVLIRIIDAICDPLIGHFSDRLAQKNFARKKLIYISSAFLCLSFYLVFNPPKTLTQNLAIVWFFLSLTLTYFFFNLTIINFESLVALSAKKDEERIRINSAKEFFGVIGMIFAFLIPTVLTNFFGFNQDFEYLILSICFAVLIFVAVAGFLRKIQVEEETSPTLNSKRKSFGEIAKNKNFLALLTILLINGIAVSLPAANLNFYVSDVLQRKNDLGWFLTVYFISACCFIPFWGAIATKFGAIKTWIISISGSVLTFFCAYFLGSENADYFYLICFFSGIFLGCDLITPPALLAKITSEDKSLTSSYFSLWNFITKISLMIAASGSLIALGWFGYSPGKVPESSSLEMISFFYSLLPCFIKLVTIALLIRFLKKITLHENH